MNPDAMFYHQDLFVNRHAEVVQVETALNNLVNRQDDVLDHSRILLFRGSRGYGKSWLSIHLHRMAIPEWKKRNNCKVISIWIGLDIKGSLVYGHQRSENEILYFDTHSKNGLDGDRFENRSPERLIGNLLYLFAEMIDAYRSKEVIEAPRTQWIIDELKEKYSADEGPTYLTVILDSVFETDWSHLRELERALLAPLSELPNVLLILTGRGRDYIWNTAAFRIVRPHNLDTLEPQDSEDQIRKQFLDKVTDLSEDEKQKLIANAVKYSGGYPLNNLLVARSLLHPNEWQVNLDVLIETYPGLSNSHRVVIKALSVLSPYARFRDEEIEILVAVLPNPPANVRQVRQELADRLVIRWDSGGWLMDEALTAFQHALLRLNPPEQETYRQLHQTALQMYTAWQQELDDTTFAKEINYHERSLDEIKPHPSEAI